MTTYRNTVTYTSPDRDGQRHEATTDIELSRPLTVRGAERILRRVRGNDQIVVSRVEAIAYA